MGIEIYREAFMNKGYYDTMDLDLMGELCDRAVSSLVKKGAMTEDDKVFLEFHGEPPDKITDYNEEEFEGVDLKRLNKLWDMMYEEREILEDGDVFEAEVQT